MAEVDPDPMSIPYPGGTGSRGNYISLREIFGRLNDLESTLALRRCASEVIQPDDEPQNRIDAVEQWLIALEKRNRDLQVKGKALESRLAALEKKPETEFHPAAPTAYEPEEPEKKPADAKLLLREVMSEKISEKKAEAMRDCDLEVWGMMKKKELWCVLNDAIVLLEGFMRNELSDVAKVHEKLLKLKSIINI